MENNAKIREVLDDLIQVNNDRITAYERALREAGDENPDLKGLYALMIAESHRIRIALVTEVQNLGGNIEQGTTTSGKIYRVWMDVNAIFTGTDRHVILENCDIIETAVEEAYRTALEETSLPAFIRDLLSEQLEALAASHEEIKLFHELYV